jgi:hypothetical protein
MPHGDDRIRGHRRHRRQRDHRRLVRGDPVRWPALQLVWDGEGAVGKHPDRLTAECQAFRGTLATRVYVCQPADPEAKGYPGRIR